MNVKMINYKKEIVIGFIGAVIGALVAMFFDGWSDNRETLTEAKMQNIIVQSKTETLNMVQDLLLQVGEQRASLDAIKSRALEDSEYFTQKRSEIQNVLDGLTSKTNLTTEDIIRVFQPSINSEIEENVKNLFDDSRMIPSGAIILIARNTNCPGGSSAIAKSAIQVSRGDGNLHKKSSSVSEDTSWNITKYYDGMVFKMCLYQ